MNSRDVKKLLFDVENACIRVLKFLEGHSFEDFSGDELLQSAVERQSEIIGEALNQAIAIDRSLSARITNVRRIIDFRNRLIHGYAGVSPQVVWGIISNDVAILLEEVRALMKEP